MLKRFYCLIVFLSDAGNGLGPVGGAHIAEALKELTGLQTLRLSGMSAMQDLSFLYQKDASLCLCS